MSKNDEIIIITAARPGLWMRERFSPSAIKRWLGETFYKDYGKTMEKLRQIDDAIYGWIKDIEDLNKQLKERYKMPGHMDDKRVVDIARLLGAINRRFKKIDRAGDILEEMTESHLKEFEESFPIELPEGKFHETTQKEMEEVEKLRDADDLMFAEAGFWDDLKQKWLTRKMETSSAKARREAIKGLVGKADNLVKRLKGMLKGLGKARSSGNVGEYLSTLNTISEEQQTFENSFVEVYESYVKEHVDKMLAEEADKAPDTIVDPQTGELEGPKTIEEEIVEDLGGQVDPGESVPQDPEEWMIGQIMEDDLAEFAPEGIPPTVPMTEKIPTIPREPLLPSFTEAPSTQPGSIDVELPGSLEQPATSKPRSVDVELPESWDQPESWQPPKERQITPQSNQPKTKKQKQPGERPGRQVKEWQPPSFRDIFVQEEEAPQTEEAEESAAVSPTMPSPAGPQQVSFKGISPSEMNVDEFSSGLGKARRIAPQVEVISKALRNFFNKTAELPPSDRARAMLIASEKFENIDGEMSATFLSLADTILEDVK
jgi:hypothetical protein